MKYETVNPDTWKRGNLFCFYIDNMRNVMSMTVDIDVSSLITFARTHELKFYPAMMWVVSKAVNQREEFKYGWDNKGNLIHWDYISPYSADFHKDDEKYVKIVTEYPDRWFDLHSTFVQD